MSQPSLSDFQLERQPPSSGGSWRDWPPAAQSAIGCGTAVAITIVISGLALWGLLAASLKMMAVSNAGSRTPPAKTAPAPKRSLETPAPGSHSPPKGNTR